MSSSGNVQNFNNKIPLRIKKYIIGKEKDDLITSGKFFVQFKYLIENDCNLSIINNTNINVNININNYNHENAKKEELTQGRKDINDKNKNKIDINNIISNIPQKINNITNEKYMGNSNNKRK